MAFLRPSWAFSPSNPAALFHAALAHGVRSLQSVAPDAELCRIRHPVSPSRRWPSHSEEWSGVGLRGLRTASSRTTGSDMFQPSPSPLLSWAFLALMAFRRTDRRFPFRKRSTHGLPFSTGRAMREVDLRRIAGQAPSISRFRERWPPQPSWPSRPEGFPFPGSRGVSFGPWPALPFPAAPS